MPAARTGGGASRILLVDDDVSVIDMFSRTLRLEGFEIWAARSTGEGVELARKHRPHALILDLRIPMAASLRLLRALRAVPGLASVPAAIVTGDCFHEEAQAMDARSLGATLRSKPLWMDELVGLARELLTAPVRD